MVFAFRRPRSCAGAVPNGSMSSREAIVSSDWICATRLSFRAIGYVLLKG